MMNITINNEIIIIIAEKMKLPWESNPIRKQKAFQSSKLWKAFLLSGPSWKMGIVSLTEQSRMLMLRGLQLVNVRTC